MYTLAQRGGIRRAGRIAAIHIHNFTTLHSRLQAKARDRLAHGDHRLTVAKWQVQTAKLATGNNMLPEVRSLFCTFKFIHQNF